jgi:hypothetical protein
MYWRWEPHWQFMERMLKAIEPQPAPEPTPLPAPAPEPTPAPRTERPPFSRRDLKGVDRMKSLFAQVGRQHYHHHRRH